MRIALLLSGQLRSFPETWPTFQRHVIDKLPTAYVDVFAHAPSEPESRSLFDYGFRQILIEEPPLIPDQQYRRIAQMPGKPWYPVSFVAQAHLRRLWALASVGRMLDTAEQLQGWVYDWVIRSRYDLAFTSDIENLSELDPNAIYLPRFSNWWGYNDRFAFGSSALIKRYCESWMTKDAAIAEQGRMHSESHLKWHLDQLGCPIRRTSILFDTVRHGESDPPKFDRSLGDICD